MPLRLRPLRLDDEAQAQAAHAELAEEGVTFLLFRERSAGWPDYLEALDAARRGTRLPERMVPATFLAAELDGRLVGRVSIRHELNDWLTRVGGHIGYAVRPADRLQGHATEILRQALVVARSLGIDRVLVTCDEDNAGSARVIERCGGVLQDVVPGDGPYAGTTLKRRYWIS
jgi:predicted acetyltransferase